MRMSGQTRSGDSHIHLFEHGFESVATSPGTSEVEQYERLRVDWGIGDALVVGYEGEARFAGNNAYLAELARTRPWIRPLAYIGPGTVPEDVARQLRSGFDGISVYLTEGATAAATEAALRGALPAVTARGGIVSLNVAPAHYGALARIAASSPDTVILVSHLGLPAVGASSREDAAAGVRRLCSLARHPRVHVKLSGLYALGPLDQDDAIRPLLRAFGPDRMVWGSDYPVVLGHESFAQTRAIPALDELTDAERDLILGGTLARLLERVGRT